MHRLSRAAARSAGAALLLCAGSALAAVPAAAAPAAPTAPVRGDAPAGVPPAADFDADGHADQVIAAPHGTVGGKAEAGYVAVVHGSARGADIERRQVLSQATAGVPGAPAARARWGARTVARDLDGDGTTDLAVHAPGAPGVTVLWGAPGRGLGGATALPDALGTDGSNLVGGDFNGDGRADLVAGSSADGSTDLRVLYGPFDREGRAADTGDLTTGRVFTPTELIAGDTTGDGADDLISMHAFEEMAERSQFWRGGSGGVADESAPLQAAASGTVGDVDGDGYGDLVIRTVPGGVVENLPYDHGTVKVLYGTGGTPGSTGRTTTLTQNSTGVPGVNEDGDQFGHALSAGDVTGDGLADIAVGVPYEDLTSASERDTGAAVLLKGSGSGLSGAGAQAFHQATPGVPGAAEARDGFGTAVSLRDMNADRRADLAVGTPGEDSRTLSDTGAAWVLRGSSGGLTTDGVVSFGPGQLGAPEQGARLGSGFAR